MKEVIFMSGVVIFSAPAGENDRRMIILTREQGRVTAFANGCRKATSPLAAFTRPFTFAKFNLFPGKDSYHLMSAEMIESFDAVSSDFDAMTYGSYFLELAGYFGVDGAPAPDEVDLLYVAIKALLKKNMSNRLIRAVYELRSLKLQGIAPNPGQCPVCGKNVTTGYFLPSKHGIACRECVRGNEELVWLNESASYCFAFALTADVRRLFSFRLEEKAEEAFCDAVKQYYRRHINRHFKSLEMIWE